VENCPDRQTLFWDLWQRRSRIRDLHGRQRFAIFDSNGADHFAQVAARGALGLAVEEFLGVAVNSSEHSRAPPPPRPSLRRFGRSDASEVGMRMDFEFRGPVRGRSSFIGPPER